MKSIKLTEVANLVRNGQLVTRLLIPNAKVFSSAETLDCFMTIYYQKHVLKQDGDEILNFYGKEFNLTKLINDISYYNSLSPKVRWNINIGKNSYNYIIISNE